MPKRLLSYGFQRRRRAMSIAPDRTEGASSVGAAPARDPVFMPLLRSLAVFVGGFYKHAAPAALGNLRRRPFLNPIRAICVICGPNIRGIWGTKPCT